MPRKKKSSAPAAPRPLTGPQRLNKILAAAGLGSRRDCEQLILDGRIEVDGQTVTDLATKVDPETAKIAFDGSLLKSFRPVYFALHKPSGVLSSNRDPSGRMLVTDLVNVKERIFSVGRLDRSSEGLMLLTNDGELAQRLAHPRYGVQKLYLATVQGEVTQVDLEKLVRGVRLAEGFARVDAVKLRRQRSGAAELEIALSEGKNREIRRILARLGHKVVGLRRLAIGPLRLGQLPVGGWRPLTREEVAALYAASAGERRKRRGPPRLSKPGSREQREPEEAVSLGLFTSPEDDFEEEDDDFGPPLFSDEGEEGGDDEIIALSDRSIRGTIIPYEDEEAPADQGERPRRERGPRTPRPRSGGRSGPRTGGARQASGTSRGTRSPNDLRSRAGGARSGGARSAAPRAGASRTGASNAAGPRPAASRSGAPRSGAPRPAAPRSGAARTGGPRTGSSRPAAGGSGPRGKAPRGSAPGGGAPGGAGPGGAGPRPGGSRPGGSRPGGSRPSGPRSGGSGGRPSGRGPGSGPKRGGGGRPPGGGGRSSGGSRGKRK